MLTRVTGLCAVLGGAFLVAACVYRSTLPRGCVGDECAARPMRGDTAVGTALAVLAGVLILGAAIGLLIQIRQHSRLGRLGALGATTGAVGAVLLLIALLFVGRAYGPDSSLMPAFVIPGLVLVVVGLILVAVVILRSRALPRGVATALLVGAALLLLTNEQTTAVLLATPFGLAWIAVGVALWRQRANPAAGSRSSGRGEGLKGGGG